MAEYMETVLEGIMGKKESCMESTTQILLYIQIFRLSIIRSVEGHPQGWNRNRASWLDQDAQRELLEVEA